MEKFIRTSHRGKKGLFLSLSVSFIKHPVQNINNLSLSRLINLYRLLFKENDHLATSVIENYLRFLIKPSPSVSKAGIFKKAFPRVVEFEKEKNPLVSIIIPVYNQFEYTMKCLESINTFTKSVKIEIIIADDNSTDETKQISLYAKNAIHIKNKDNMGFLRNCNQAVNYAKGAYLLFINNDTVVTEGWLNSLLETFNRHPEAGIVGPKILYQDGSLQEAGSIIWSDGSGWNYGKSDDPEKPEYNFLRETDYVSGCCLMIKRSIWESLGGFDDIFSPAYYEDTDLAFRVRQMGYKVIYQPKSQIFHFEGISHGTDVNSGIKKYQDDNRARFLEKWKSVLSESHFANAEHIFSARERGKGKGTIVIIDHYVPHYDRDCGSRHTFQYLKFFLEAGYNVKLIGDSYFPHEPYTTELQQMGIEVLYGSWMMRNWKTWIADNSSYIDIVYLHRPHIAQKYIHFIKMFSNIKVLYFGHDLHFLRFRRQYEIEENEDLLKEADRWKKIELDIIKNSDASFYPSFIEVEEIRRHVSTNNVSTLPLYLFDPEPRVLPNNQFRSDIMFIGSFLHPPNYDSIIWFLREIFPAFHKDHPTARLFIVGSNIPDEIKALASERILVEENISDKRLEELYRHIQIAVVPLRYGAGIKGKILESINYNVPVVTTSIGAEGLIDAHDYLEIADDPLDFARKLSGLYNNIEKQNMLNEKGIEMLKVHYTKEKARSIFDQEMSRIGKN